MASIATVLDPSAGVSVYDGWAVRSDDFELDWFVAVQLQGEGFESGHIAVFATNAMDEDGEDKPGQMFAVGAFANEFSDLGDGGDTQAGFSRSNDGASIAEGCVEAAQPDRGTSFVAMGIIVLTDPASFISTEAFCFGEPVGESWGEGTDVTITPNGGDPIHAFTTPGVPIADGTCNFTFTQWLPEADRYTVTAMGAEYVVERASIFPGQQDGTWVFEIRP